MCGQKTDAHYQKLCVGLALTQKELSCDHHSPRCLAEKQAHHHFILPQIDTYNLGLKVICQFFVLLKLNDLIVCLFSVRHLGECWPHDSPFCVNVTPMHIFGNVQLEKGNVHVHTNTF